MVDELERVGGFERLARSRAGLGLETAVDRLVQWVRRGRGGCGGRRVRRRNRLHLPAGIGRDIVGTVLILAGQHAVGAHGGHHLRGVGVEDRKVKPGLHREGQEGCVHEPAAWQPEADVRDAEHRAHPELLFDKREGAQRLACRGLFGRDGQGQTVDVDVLTRDAGGVGGRDDPAGDGKPAFGRRRDAVFVECQPDDSRAVLFTQRQNFGEDFSSPLTELTSGLPL